MSILDIPLIVDRSINGDNIKIDSHFEKFFSFQKKNSQTNAISLLDKEHYRKILHLCDTCNGYTAFLFSFVLCLYYNQQYKLKTVNCFSYAGLRGLEKETSSMIT